MYKPGERLGEKITNTQGDQMIIIAENGDNVTVMFKDGTIARDSWRQFKRRRIRKDKGEAAEQDYGFLGHITDVPEIAGIREAECIEENGEYLTVRFTDNGEIVTGVSPKDFIEGNILTEDEDDFPQERDIPKSLTVERHKTLLHTLRVLDRYRRCAVVRPCGFGKTVINMRIFESPRYRKCLYLSPKKEKSEYIERKVEKLRRQGKTVKVRTYSWLRNLSDDQLKKADFDIVCFDECHNIGGDYTEEKGAKETFLAVQKLMMYHPNTHFLGSTATAIRMDGINVISTVFLNHTAYPYNVDDAVQDGFMNAPHYFYCEYSVTEGIRNRMKAAEQKMFTDRKTHLFSEDEMEHIFGTEDVRKINAAQMPENIRETCDSVLEDTSYMRFIVFYLTISEIRENIPMVRKWFEDAYPDHRVAVHEYHSESPVTKKELESMEAEPGTIDLIFSCEKLKEEYHSDLCTGLVMDRRTQSYGLYIQMLGRVMSCGTKKPAVVFDIVDNLHSDFVLQLPDGEPEPEISKPAPKDVRCMAVPKTFAEAERMYKGAVDWDRITKPEKKTKESVAEGTQEAAEDECRLFEQIAAHAETVPVMQGLAEYTAASEFITGTEAPDGKVMSPYAAAGTRDTCGEKPETAEYTQAVAYNREPEKRPAADMSRYAEIMEKIRNEREKAVQEAGFNGKSYVQYQGRWFLKSAETKFRKTDVGEIVYEIYKKPVKAVLDKVLEEYDKYKPRYGTYEELAADKEAYKLLTKGCAWMYHIRPEIAAEYMVTGEVPKVI